MVPHPIQLCRINATGQTIYWVAYTLKNAEYLALCVKENMLGIDFKLNVFLFLTPRRISNVDFNLHDNQFLGQYTYVNDVDKVFLSMA